MFFIVMMPPTQVEAYSQVKFTNASLITILLSTRSARGPEGHWRMGVFLSVFLSFVIYSLFPACRVTGVVPLAQGTASDLRSIEKMF